MKKQRNPIYLLFRAVSLVLIFALLLSSCSKKSTTRDERINEFVRENPSLKTGQAVFIGDSITAKYKLGSHYRKAELECYNRGISGDTTDWLIARLDVSLFAIRPSKIVLMIGTNDINGGKTPDEIALNYSLILSLISQRLPNAKVICVSIIPQNEEYSEDAHENNGRIKLTNEKIEALAHKHGYEYVDLYSHLTDESGLLKHGYSYDGLHLSRRGYRVWTRVMKSKI